MLQEGAIEWIGLESVDLSFLIFITFIATIAATVQSVGLVMEKFIPHCMHHWAYFCH